MTSENEEPEDEGLDLAADEQPEDKPLVEEKPFNPELWHERVRTGVALVIIGAVIAESLILTFAFVTGAIAASDLSAATAAIITPMVGIAGTVLGFYFGTHRRGDGTGG